MSKLTTSADTNGVYVIEAGLSEVSIQTLDSYRGISIYRTADVNRFPAPASDQFCFVARYRPADDAPVLSTHATIAECREAIDQLAYEAGYQRLTTTPTAPLGER